MPESRLSYAYVDREDGTAQGNLHCEVLVLNRKSWTNLLFYNTETREKGRRTVMSGCVESGTDQHFRIFLSYTNAVERTNGRRKRPSTVRPKHWQVKHDLLCEMFLDGSQTAISEHTICKGTYENPVDLTASSCIAASGFMFDDVSKESDQPLSWKKRGDHLEELTKKPKHCRTIDELSSIKLRICRCETRRAKWGKSSFPASSSLAELGPKGDGPEEEEFESENYKHEKLSHHIHIDDTTEIEELQGKQDLIPDFTRKSKPFLEFVIYYKDGALMKQWGYLDEPSKKRETERPLPSANEAVIVATAGPVKALVPDPVPARLNPIPPVTAMAESQNSSRRPNPSSKRPSSSVVDATNTKKRKADATPVAPLQATIATRPFQAHRRDRGVRSIPNSAASRQAQTAQQRPKDGLGDQTQPSPSQACAEASAQVFGPSGSEMSHRSDASTSKPPGTTAPRTRTSESSTKSIAASAVPASTSSATQRAAPIVRAPSRNSLPVSQPSPASCASSRVLPTPSTSSASSKGKDRASGRESIFDRGEGDAEEEKKPDLGKLLDQSEQRVPRHVREGNAAQAFLQEVGIKDDGNLQALLDVGFKSKDSFLARLPLLEPRLRRDTLQELRCDMGRLDYRI